MTLSYKLQVAVTALSTGAESQARVAIAPDNFVQHGGIKIVYNRMRLVLVCVTYKPTRTLAHDGTLGVSVDLHTLAGSRKHSLIDCMGANSPNTTTCSIAEPHVRLRVPTDRAYPEIDSKSAIFSNLDTPTVDWVTANYNTSSGNTELVGYLLIEVTVRYSDQSPPTTGEMPAGDDTPAAFAPRDVRYTSPSRRLVPGDDSDA